MPDYLDPVRKALEGDVTEGPWHYEDCKSRDSCWCGCVKAEVNDEQDFDGYVVPSGSVAKANAALISACDPPTVRRLLAERDALREALALLVSQVEALNGSCDGNPPRGAQPPWDRLTKLPAARAALAVLDDGDEV